MTTVFFITFCVSLSVVLSQFVSFYFRAPTHREKFLVRRNLCGNKPISDCLQYSLLSPGGGKLPQASYRLLEAAYK